MAGKLVITKKNGKIISAFYEENKLCELQFEPEDTKVFLGNIYTAKVKNIVKNINAAFVEVEDGQLCYYSLVENKEPYFLNQKKTKTVVAGDELLVQISKEPMKSKLAGATSYLNITGKYLVLTVGKGGIGISGKIQIDNEKKRLKECMNQFRTKEYGWIVRTNAQGIAEEVLILEAERLKSRYEALNQIARYRTCGQKLYEAPKAYLTEIRDQNSSHYERIITDDKQLFEEIKTYLVEYQPEDLEKLQFYEDKMISLQAMLNMEKDISEALREKVWLKSGGYLIIQPTEAMVVIDVNTGKALNRKKMQEHFKQINLEAAKEIARQMRLRNLSGIIIVDFIDMESESDREVLMKALEEEVSKDRIKADVIDITKLNLVEITRKKTKKPIYEQIKEGEI